MQLIRERPPLYDEIDAAFKVRGKPVLFSWGDVVYAPNKCNFPPQLQAHENVHGIRQMAFIDGGIEGWWRRYIRDPEFRLEEEKLAHGAEYLKQVEMMGGGRDAKRTALSIVAKRLSAKLYRYKFTTAQAREFLEAGYFE